jgi:hypothetical protein
VTDIAGNVASSNDEITIAPVAETPALSVTSVSGNENSPIALSITAVQAESDLALANLTVNVSGLQGATLNTGTLNADGSYTLTAAQLSGIKLTPAADFTGVLDLRVVATDAEPTSGTTASSAPQTLHVTIQSDGVIPPATPVFNLAPTDQIGTTNHPQPIQQSSP